MLKSVKSCLSVHSEKKKLSEILTKIKDMTHIDCGRNQKLSVSLVEL